MPAIAETKARTLTDDPRVKASAARIAEIQAELRDAIADVERYRKIRLEDEITQAAAAISAGQSSKAAVESARVPLEDAEKRVAACQVSLADKNADHNELIIAVVREIQEPHLGEFALRKLGVIQAVEQLAREILSLGEFQNEMKERGAEFTDAAWQHVLGTAETRANLLLPKPGAITRTMEAYLKAMLRHSPELSDDVKPLLADWS